jgi:hypothetical protein
MEKQKATFKAYSKKTNGVCLDIGEGDVWYTPTEKVMNFVPNLERKSEVLVVVDENKNLSFIQQVESQDNGTSSNGIEKMSCLKNKANKRMSALNNATNLAIAKGGLALDEKKVLQTAKEFLDFLGE